MFKWKNLTVLIFMFVLILTVGDLWAGGQKESSPAETKVKIEWWTVSGGDDAAIEWLNRVKDGFTKENPKIEVVRIDMQDEDFKVGLKSAMAAGIPPALWHSWGGGVLKAYVNEEQVADSTWLIKKLGKKVPLGALSTSTWDGKNYGLPYTSWAGYFFINRDLFSKAGVKIPDVTKDETWSWDEFMAAIETFKKNGITPIACGGQEKWELSFYYMYLVDRMGGSELFTKALNGEPGYSFNDPAFIEAENKILALVKANAFQSGFLGAGYNDGQRYFFSQKAAMYLNGPWIIGALRKTDPNFPLDFIRFPVVKGAKGDPHMILGAPQTIYCVSEKMTDEQKGAARQLQEYLAQDKVILDFVKTVKDLIIFDVPLSPEAYDPINARIIK
ncbi:MAG: extracellular solute-binding protein, partial [Spirochaetota bacterium]